MMKKTYEADTNQGCTMGLIVKGRPISITFDDGLQTPRVIKNKFTTADPDIQEAIEKTKQFRNGLLKLIKTTNEEISVGVSDTSGETPLPLHPEKAEVKEEVKEVKKVVKKELGYKAWSQVATYLVKQFGEDMSTLTDPTSIKEAADKHDLVLTNLK